MASELFPVSVVVHTKNSAETLKGCLESAKFAEEIIVIDMKSSDDSKKIAKEYSAKVFEVEDSGFVETVRNFGINKATQDWVLLLDADEEISDGLKIWLESFLSSPTKKDVSAFYFPRKNYIFGQEIRHTGWWPDYNLRFFKKGAVSWKEEIHSQPEIKGKAEHLPADSDRCLVHYNYKNVTQYIERMNRYTGITADQLGSKKSLSASELMQSFSDDFVRRMFKWDGVRDGGLGLSLSLLQGSYQLLVELKQWEKGKFFEKNSDEQETVAAINQFKKDLAYWIADWHVKNSSGLSKIGWVIRRKLRT